MTDFAKWLAENPWPDLQKFVREFGNPGRMDPKVWATFSEEDRAKMQRHGAFRCVRPEEWAEYDKRVAAWLGARRNWK
jgi:hypothetical protein